MKPLSEAVGARLEWREPKALKRYYELRTNQDIFGSLAFNSAFGTLAAAETNQRKWTFKRVGFLKPRITVREPGSEIDAAIYQPKLRGDGNLMFPDGTTFHWKPNNFWSTQWAFYDSTDKAFVSFNMAPEMSKLSDAFKTHAIVEINPAAASHGSLALLATLGWYLIVLHRQDAAITAVSTG